MFYNNERQHIMDLLPSTSYFRQAIKHPSQLSGVTTALGRLHQATLYRVYKKKLNKPEIAHQLCKAPQCTKFFIEIGCLGTDNVV